MNYINKNPGQTEKRSAGESMVYKMRERLDEIDNNLAEIKKANDRWFYTSMTLIATSVGLVLLAVKYLA